MGGFTNEQKDELQALFHQQQLWLTTQFHEERTYYRQLIRDELTDIRERLDRLAERTHEESTLIPRESFSPSSIEAGLKQKN